MAYDPLSYIFAHVMRENARIDTARDAIVATQRANPNVPDARPDDCSTRDHSRDECGARIYARIPFDQQRDCD